MESKYFRRENQITVSLISTIIILIAYIIWVYNRHIADSPETLNDLQFWGRSFLILIPVMIVAQIIIHIIFAIINKIITRQDIPSKTDEMGQLIELKSLRISRWVQSVFFILAMAALAMNYEIWVMFVLLIASCFLSTIVESLAQIYYYRKGV